MVMCLTSGAPPNSPELGVAVYNNVGKNVVATLWLCVCSLYFKQILGDFGVPGRSLGKAVRRILGGIF